MTVDLVFYVLFKITKPYIEWAWPYAITYVIEYFINSVEIYNHDF